MEHCMVELRLATEHMQKTRKNTAFLSPFRQVGISVPNPHGKYRQKLRFRAFRLGESGLRYKNTVFLHAKESASPVLRGEA